MDKLNSPMTIVSIIVGCALFLAVAHNAKADEAEKRGAAIIQGVVKYFCFSEQKNPERITCELDVIENEAISTQRPSKKKEGGKTTTRKGERDSLSY